MELVSKQGNRLTHMRQMEGIGSELETSDLVAETKMLQMDLGQGKTALEIHPPRSLFYETVSKVIVALTVKDDGDLMNLLTDLSQVRQKYDKVAPALQDAYPHRLWYRGSRAG